MNLIEHILEHVKSFGGVTASIRDSKIIGKQFGCNFAVIISPEDGIVPADSKKAGFVSMTITPGVAGGPLGITGMKPAEAALTAMLDDAGFLRSLDAMTTKRANQFATIQKAWLARTALRTALLTAKGEGSESVSFDAADWNPEDLAAIGACAHACNLDINLDSSGMDVATVPGKALKPSL
jgi:hypothetical protein